jgi:drug/metabolite transporter (DMT)-like permease
MGELAALSASLLWAFASVIYARMGQYMSPLGLNLGKGVIAIALLILTLALQNQLVPDFSIQSMVVLSCSGAIGIGIGDTVFFAALRDLGARRTLLLQSLAPPITACLAFLVLQETLASWAWVGMSLTLVGVAWVISERTSPLMAMPPAWQRGVSLALLAALAQASGAVLSRFALAGTSVSPLWSALLRLCAGVLLLLVARLLRQGTSLESLAWPSPKVWLGLFLAAFGGTYLGIWLQQVGLKYTAAGIAQTLGATSPLFILPMAMALGEQVSLRAWLGAGMAVGGVALMLVVA